MKLALVTTCFLWWVAATAAKGKRGPRIKKGDKFVLDWTIDVEKGTITFDLEAKTEGWLAIAWSDANGIAHAKSADSVIAWVEDKGGKVVALDCIGTGGQEQPKVDVSQHVTIVSGEQKKDKTLVSFTKPLQAADAEDISIISGQMRISWAYGDKDGTGNSVQVHKEWATYQTNLMDGNATVIPIDENIIPPPPAGNSTVPPTDQPGNSTGGVDPLVNMDIVYFAAPAAALGLTGLGAVLIYRRNKAFKENIRKKLARVTTRSSGSHGSVPQGKYVSEGPGHLKDSHLAPRMSSSKPTSFRSSDESVERMRKKKKLMKEWRAKTDPKTGHTRYINRVTGETRTIAPSIIDL